MNFEPIEPGAFSSMIVDLKDFFFSLKPTVLTLGFVE